jgi:hypothetical protein
MNGAEAIAGRFELVNPHARGKHGRSAPRPRSADRRHRAVRLIWRRGTGEEVSLTEADKNAAKFMREARIMSRQPEPAVGHRRRH